MKMKTLFIGLVLAVTSGCSVASSTGDHFTMTGTPKGIKAFSDYQNGIIRTAKESRNQSSEYFAHRGTEEKEHTNRCASAVGFWEKISQCH